MNYCTKCQSYYQQPGTCNCFAPTQPVISPPYIQPYVQPWNPYSPFPTNWPSPYVWPGQTITVWSGTPWQNVGTVDIAHAAGDQPLQWSYTGIQQ